MNARRLLSFAAALGAALAVTAFRADASVLVNKAFSPTSVQLGVTSDITITLSNTSTVTAATVTSLADDIATMGGKAAIASPSNIATTCAGGTPSIAGTVVSLAGGVIPAGVDSTHPGTCTVTFTVVGTSVGNGINSIAAGALVTDQGTNATAASQTLQVLTSTLAVTGSTTTSQLSSATATQTYTVTNPTASAITNATFPITLTNGGTSPVTQFTLAGASTGSCAGSVTPSSFTSTNANPSVGTATVSGLTIPANGSCTITLSLTDPVAATSVTATGTLAAAAISDDQGITNSATVTGKSQFFNGLVALSKSFAPSTAVAGSTSRMSIVIKNTQTIALTGVAITDALPASMTLDAAPAAAYTNCGSPALSGQGTGTLGISGATVAAATTLGTSSSASTCTIVVTVDVSSGATGSLVNTIPTANFTDAQSVGAAAAASATLTISTGALTATKSGSASTAVRNVPVTETLTFSNGGGTALTAGMFTDNLPQTPVAMQYYSGFTPTFTNCGANSPTVTASGGNTIVTGSNLTIPASSSCVVKFQVTLASGGYPQQTDTNVIPAANVTFTDSGSNLVHPPAPLSATLSTLPAFTIKNFVGPNYGGVANQPVAVQGQIVYSAATPGLVTDTNVSATFVLNASGVHNVKLATTPNFQFSGCPSGTTAANVTAAGNGESFVVALTSISATCTITYNVVNENTITPPSAAYGSGIDTYASTENGSPSTSNPQVYTVSFYTTSLLVNKVFTPNSIASGGTATAKFTLDVAAVPQLSSTQANGVAFTDALPANMTFAVAPNVTLSAGCTQSGQPAATGTPSGTSIAFANVSLVSGSDCVATFDVTSNFLGNTTNTIAASALTSTSGATNTQSASASLTVVAGVALQKTFLNSAFAIGDVNFVRFLIVNSSSGVLTSGTLTDNMPASLALSSLTAQPAAQGGDPVSCGGIVTGTIGSSTFQLGGMTVAGASGPSMPGECVQYVQVTASSSAGPGSVVNSIPAGGLDIGGQVNLTGASTPPETLSAAPNATVTQAFAPASITQGGTSTLTITIANTSGLAAALSGVALTDSLPAGVTVAAVPNAATTCGAGTVSAVAGSASAALAGGSLAANTSCTISFNVTSVAAATYTNTLAAGALATTQGATNAQTTATLTVSAAPNVTLTKAFAPVAIGNGGTAVLTLTIANTAGGATALGAIALTDPLPTGLTVAATPGAATTCPSGTLAASAGASSVILSGATLAAGATCTVSVNVTAASAGSFTNTIAAGALTSAQGASNAAAATATLSVVSVTLAKAFAPASITAGAASVLTITIPNTGTGAIALSGMALTDTLPSGVTIAATPNATTTCGAGIATAVAGGASIALTAGSVAAGGTCTVTVNVTGTAVAAYTNTIAAGALNTTQGITNAAPATATLTITSGALALTKAFAPAAIGAGGTSTLTVTLANTAPGAAALTAIALSDTLPAGMVVAAAPNASTTCGAGTTTAVAGSSTVALTAGSVAGGATCTLVVNVTSSVAGSETNTIPAGALSTAQSVTNASPASASLTVGLNGITLAKAFSPASIAAGGTSVLTITIPNTASGAVALTGVALTDALPSGITVATTPNASTTCGAGAVTAVAGSGSIALAGGTLGAGATCTIGVNVTGIVASTYTNTIPAGALTTTPSVTNAAPASASLTVTVAPAALSVAFAPQSIAAGATSTLTITIPNSAPGAVALTNMALDDALPSGLTIGATPNATTTCGSGTVTAVAGGTSLALAGGNLGAGASCTIVVTVTATTAGAYADVIPAGALTTAQAVTNAAPASATLTVTLNPIAIGKAFAPAAIAAGGTATLTITIPNTGAGAVTLSALGLTDAMPAGITIASVPAASTTCGGTLTAIAGSASLSLAGGSVAAAASCTIVVSVTSTVLGAHVNTIASGALVDAQTVTNTAPANATLTVTNALPVTLTKSFVPASIALGATSILTIALANTAPGAGALTAVALTDALPAGTTIASVPNAATTCGSGALAAAAGSASFGLTNATLGANATCTMSVAVTSSTTGVATNTIPAGALTSTQGVSNAAAASATLTVSAAPSVTLALAYAPATIGIGGVSVATITIANTAAQAIALSAIALTDTFPAGTLVAPVPNASTTCAGGAVTAAAGGTQVNLGSATLAANASCTVSVNVTGPAVGAFVNTIAAHALSSAQGASNAAAVQATLTIAAVSLQVSKTSNAAGTGVAPGGTVTYTIVVKNTGAIAETHATVADTLANATFVPGSLTVNGAAAPDAVLLAAAPFGSIAPGASATLVYTALVAASAVPGTSLTNGVTANGDQTCSGATCAAVAAPVAVVAPVLTIVTTIDGQQSETVVPGQVVTYAMTVTNTSAVTATSVNLINTAPDGAVPIAGSVTLGGSPLAVDRSARVSQSTSSVNGQVVTVPIGTLAAGANVVVTFQAKMQQLTTNHLIDSASVSANGLPSAVVSNEVVALMIAGTLHITKTASASVATVGDRVNFLITVAPPGGTGLGATTIVDTLPPYEAYAPGTARVAGAALEPAIAGRVLTWTLPELTTATTISYATAIAPGAQPQSLLTNVVAGSGASLRGASPSTGSASATVLVVGTTFGSCYPITGRVFVDVHDSGRFTDGDRGVPGVHIVMEDGESVVTDAEGRYDFPCVAQGMHAMRLDTSSLPPDVSAFDDRRLDSTRSTRRLIHAALDATIIEDINFAVRPVPR